MLQLLYYVKNMRSAVKMKRFKGILAVMLCLCMTLSNGILNPVAAGLYDESQQIAEDAITEGATVTDADDVENNNQYGLVNYLVVGQPRVNTPDTQQILVGIGDKTAPVDYAVLHYTNVTTGNAYDADAQIVDDESVLFTLDFSDNSLAGEYVLNSIEYSVGNEIFSVDLANTDIDAAFGVNADVDTNPDGLVVESDGEDSGDVSFVISDAEGNEITADSIEAAVKASVSDNIGSADYGRAPGTNNIVVVLDPGHGGSDAGATRKWNGVYYYERDINLKIALACKQELEQYKGVDVYLTRSTNTTFAVPTENPKKMEIRERCQYGKDMNADLLVSLHINASGSDVTSTNGAEVYYPNASYNPEISKMGKALGEAILKKLQELGIANRGTHYRDSTDGETYPDGSIADYYGINRYCKRHGFPGIIVEHAYINNAHDVSSFLSSDATLNKIGVADATAIAGFLNLSKQDPVTDGATSVAVLNNDGKSFTLRTDGIPSVHGVKYFIVNENDPNLILNYGAIPGGDGSWYSSFNISDFGFAGTYFIDTYVARPNDSYFKVGQTVTVNVEGNQASGKLSIANSDKNKGKFDAVVTDVTSSRAVSGIEIRAWSEENKSNMYTYIAAKQSDGSYVAHIDTKNHGDIRGRYTVKAYVVSDNGVKTEVASTTHDIPYGDVNLYAFDADGQNTFFLIADKIPYNDVVNVNFDVTFNGVNTKKTYGASKDQSGRWLALFPVCDFGKAGTYSVTAYAKRSGGSNLTLGSFDFTVDAPKASGISIKNVSGSGFDAVVEGISTKSGIVSVRIPAWTKGDLSDLHWYQATKQSDGTYAAHIEIKNHNYNYGVYAIQAYIKTANTIEAVAASTCYDFSQKLQNAYGFNSGNDEDYILVAEGVPYGNEVSKVIYDVWKNGNDHRPYYAFLDASGRWMAAFKVSDYGEAGTYHSDVYVELKNKSKVKVGSMEFGVNAPEVSTVTIKNENKNLGTFDAVITGINSPSGVSSVMVPAWTKGDLSDLFWYAAKKQNDGSYVATINIKNHNYNTGVYAVQAFVAGNNGVTSQPASVCHNFELAPANVYSCDTGDNNNYIFVAENVPFADKISTVRYDIWVNSPNNCKSINSIKDTSGRWLGFFAVNMFNAAGKYNVTAYAVYNDGKSTKLGEFGFDVAGPTAEGISVENVNNGLGTFDVVISGVKSSSGVSQVIIPVWSKGDLSDLYYYNATLRQDGKYVAHVDVKKHGYNYGVYAIQAYVTGKNGITALTTSTCFNLEKPVAKISAGTLVDGTAYMICASDIPYAGNVTELTVAVWRTGADDLKFYGGAKNADGSWLAMAPVADHRKNGVYYTDVYAKYSDGSTQKLGGASYEVGNSYYEIMGESTISVEKMASYFKKYAAYPEFYATTDAPTLEDFCRVYLEECAAEGVKAEVAFCQAMKETGYLKFGGDVTIEQFNFAGLGAIGDGAGGATFGSVREGVRAHVQHLKAYASKDALNNPCVDPRFDLVGRGVAPYVEWLGAKENPNGRGWAMAVGYGFSIRYDYMEVLFAQ